MRIVLVTDEGLDSKRIAYVDVESMPAPRIITYKGKIYSCVKESLEPPPVNREYCYKEIDSLKFETLPNVKVD